MDYGNGGFFNLDLREFTFDQISEGVTIKGLFEAAKRATELGKVFIVNLPNDENDGETVYFSGITLSASLIYDDVEDVRVWKVSSTGIWGSISVNIEISVEDVLTFSTGN